MRGKGTGVWLVAAIALPLLFTEAAGPNKRTFRGYKKAKRSTNLSKKAFETGKTDFIAGCNSVRHAIETITLQMSKKRSTIPSYIKIDIKCRDIYKKKLGGAKPNLPNYVEMGLIPITEKDTKMQFGNLMGGSVANRYLIGLTGYVRDGVTYFRQLFAEYPEDELVAPVANCTFTRAKIPSAPREKVKIVPAFRTKGECAQWLAHGIQVSDGHITVKYCKVDWKAAKVNDQSKPVNKKRLAECEGKEPTENLLGPMAGAKTIVDVKGAKLGDPDGAAEETAAVEEGDGTELLAKQTKLGQTQQEFLKDTIVRTIEYTNEQQAVIDGA